MPYIRFSPVNLLMVYGVFIILGYSCFNSFPNRIDSAAPVRIGSNLFEAGNKMALII